MSQGVRFGVSLGSGSVVVASSTIRGRQDVVADDAGERQTPLCVAFANGEVLTGLAAKNASVRHPRHSCAAVMPLLARDPAAYATRVKQSCLVEVTESPVGVVLPTMNPEAPAGDEDADGSPVKPTELLAAVFSHLKKLLVNAAGPLPVHALTIACPRYVDAAAVAAAAREAAVVPEATAIRVVPDDSAIAMLAAEGVTGLTAAGATADVMVQEGSVAGSPAGSPTSPTSQGAPNELMVGGDLRLGAGAGGAAPASPVVMVADWGASSFNAAVLRLTPSGPILLGQARRWGVGGRAVDKAATTIASQAFQRRTRIDPAEDARAIRKLTLAAEKAKAVLASAPTAMVEVEAFCNGVDLRDAIGRLKLDMAFDALGAAAIVKEAMEAALTQAAERLGVDGPAAVGVTTVLAAGGNTKFARARGTLVTQAAALLPGVEVRDATTHGAEAAALGACAAAQCVNANVWAAPADDATTAAARTVAFAPSSVGEDAGDAAAAAALAPSQKRLPALPVEIVTAGAATLLPVGTPLPTAVVVRVPAAASGAADAAVALPIGIRRAAADAVEWLGCCAVDVPAVSVFVNAGGAITVYAGDSGDSGRKLAAF